MGSFAGQKVDFSEFVAMEEQIDEETLERESPFPSISQAAAMAAGKCSAISKEEEEDSIGTTYIPPPLDHTPPPSPPTVEPLYSAENGTVAGG